jgi:hypothetical protein
MYSLLWIHNYLWLWKYFSKNLCLSSILKLKLCYDRCWFYTNYTWSFHCFNTNGINYVIILMLKTKIIIYTSKQWYIYHHRNFKYFLHINLQWTSKPNEIISYFYTNLIHLCIFQVFHWVWLVHWWSLFVFMICQYCRESHMPKN